MKTTVTSDGVRLAVYSAGDPANPTVVLVHGYPDTHAVWNDVVAELARRFHVVTFDNRGAGASDCPVPVAAYRIELLAADLRAVLDAVSPDAPVHLVGHDWGSILAWELVTDPAAAHRIASFTSLAGGCLDHIGHLMRRRLARPTPANLRAFGSQLARSWYVAAFQVPGLGVLPWRLGLGRRWERLLAGVERVPRRADQRVASRGSDGEVGVRLYRANMARRLGRPGQRRTEVPVQSIHAADDHFITPGMNDGLERWVPQLWRRTVQATHWAPLTHGPVIARMATELIDSVESRRSTPALDRARFPRATGEFAGRLVTVTGAGSGIGRATALAFAELGADLALCDVDITSVSETAELARRAGVQAATYKVDVSDEAGMRAFAAEVAAGHGVPDVVVNNAGIGHSGSFLSTTTAEWRRVLDVNLWGVIHGCRAFGELMVARGEGGHIVNVASAAAWLPARDLAAYSTSKAAVAMLTDCLRAEVTDHGIGVSAICPGIVDTAITRSSTFSGLDDAAQQAQRDRAAAAYRRRNFTPDRVAAEIVDAVRRNRATVPVTVEAKAVRTLARVSPAALRAASRLRV